MYPHFNTWLSLVCHDTDSHTYIIIIINITVLLKIIPMWLIATTLYLKCGEIDFIS